MKKNIAVFFGGNSPEKDISVITGLQAIANLDKSKYRVFPIFIDGCQLKYGKQLDNIAAYGKKSVGFEAAFFGKTLLCKKRYFKAVADMDCALVCTHGGSGEGGGLSGFLDIIGLPYTCCEVEQSAVMMNKITAKKLFALLKIKQVPYLNVFAADFMANKQKTVAAVLKKMPLPLIVKPSRLGSSIGIKTAQTAEELLDAFEVAMQYDDIIVVEKKLEGFAEVNCAAVLREGEVCLSAIEKPICWEEFLSFDDKYTRGGKLSQTTRELPANIPAAQSVEIRRIVKKVYEELGLSGVVRADFLIDKEGLVFLNEINTVPGSLAFYLFEEIGISFGMLLDILIDEALKKHQKAERLKKFFHSDVLNSFKKGGLGCKKLQK